MAALPPPPTNDQTGSYAWLEWFRQLRNYIATAGSVPWNIIDFAGSTIANIANRSHQLLQSLQGGTTGEYYHVTNSKHSELTNNINLSGTSGVGVKVDLGSPTYPWQDLLGPIGVKTAGATDPVWTIYRGSIYSYTFDTATAEAFFTYHIPHDYVPGTDMYIHMHWSQKVVDTGGPAAVPGNVEWNFDISYADGHGTAGGAADPFTAPITVTVVQQGSTTQYGHMIAEVQFTANGTSGGTRIDRNTIAVDGLLLVRAYRIKANAADTLNQAPFGHTCDIHYQSTGVGTKNKAPSFYV